MDVLVGDDGIVDGVEIRDVEGMGKGLCATRDLEEGEVILRVAGPSVISRAYSEGLLGGWGVWKGEVSEMSTTSVHGAMLFVGAYLSGIWEGVESRGEVPGRICAYLRVLPTLEDLNGLPALEEGNEFGARTRKEWEGDFARLKVENWGGDVSWLEEVGWEMYLRCRGCVHSRSFTSVSSESFELEFVLLPGIDMLNHDGVEANCDMSFFADMLAEEEEDEMGQEPAVVTVQRRIRAGEQCTVSYGLMTALEMWTTYGFLGSKDENFVVAVPETDHSLEPLSSSFPRDFLTSNDRIRPSIEAIETAIERLIAIETPQVAPYQRMERQSVQSMIQGLRALLQQARSPQERTFEMLADEKKWSLGTVEEATRFLDEINEKQ